MSVYFLYLLLTERERERHKKRSRSSSPPSRSDKHRSWSKDRGSRSREKRSRSRDRKSRDRRSSSRDHKKHRCPQRRLLLWIACPHRQVGSCAFFVSCLFLALAATLQEGRGRNGPAGTGMFLRPASNTSRRCSTKPCKVMPVSQRLPVWALAEDFEAVF